MQKSLPLFLKRGVAWAAPLAYDMAVAAASFLLAYLTAYGLDRVFDVPGLPEKTAAFVALCGILLALLSVSRGSWRYVSVPDLTAIIKASLAAGILYTVGAFLLTRGDNVPRSVPILTGLYMIAGLAGSRLAYRLLLEGGLKLSLSGRAGAARNVLLFGLSDNAESFIRAARRLSHKQVVVAGILDNLRANHARKVQGVKVLGALGDLQEIVGRLKRNGIEISELVVTERSPSRQHLREILDAAAACGLKVLRIPEWTETSAVTSQSLLAPKAIELGDLLGRPEVKTDLEGLARLINGRILLATGAGGSIGSELCRQIAMFNPRRLIITDSSEFHLYLLDAELRERHPDLAIVTQIVDVRDAGRVSRLFEEYKPDVVFHAAALKHVPLVEGSPVEAIKTNILGTRNAANAALAAEASAFVMISTDKAVNPTNVMGATKRAAEIYCQSLDIRSPKTRFKTVRFGNVLGSNGSVVPRFSRQIANGGPVTVTHPNIVRFFMTIPEAVRLVLNASAHGLSRQAERGKIMVLDMGKPIRIIDLAERMIQLAGLRPRIDIDIVYTGLRPGEKLYEELFDPSEVQDERGEGEYVLASPRVMDEVVLRRSLVELERAVAREDQDRALEYLRHIVPEYRSLASASASAEDFEIEQRRLVPPVELP